jgi:hypothetical protein
MPDGLRTWIRRILAAPRFGARGCRPVVRAVSKAMLVHSQIGVRDRAGLKDRATRARMQTRRERGTHGIRAMKSSNKKFSVVLGLTVAMLLCGVLFFRGSVRHPSSSNATADADAVRRERADGGSVGTAASTSALDPVDLPSRRIPLTFENARNLLQLMKETDGKRDPVSLGARARALEECWTFTISPNLHSELETADESQYDGKLPIVKKYANTHRERCVDLAQARGPRGRDVDQALRDAADAGNLWAKATLLDRSLVQAEFPDSPRDPRATPSDEIEAELESLVASHDPEVFAALAGLMSRLHPDSPFANLSGSQLHYYAWLLASCDLGKRCGADDALMRSMCLFGGICSMASDLRGFLREMLAPEDMVHVEQLEQLILSTTAGPPG